MILKSGITSVHYLLLSRLIISGWVVVIAFLALGLQESVYAATQRCTTHDDPELPSCIHSARIIPIITQLLLNDSATADTDKDSIFDINDNCPTISNPDQTDNDADGLGDACDDDDDNDGLTDLEEAEIGTNPVKRDTDDDGFGDKEDHFPLDTLSLYEAEGASLNVATIESSPSGFSGTGYVRYRQDSGDYIEWTIPFAKAGDYKLYFTYAFNANAETRLSQEIRVNGAVVAPGIDFPGTRSWSKWESSGPLVVTLNAGQNTIRLTTTGEGGVNTDYLELLPAETVVPPDDDLTTSEKQAHDVLLQTTFGPTSALVQEVVSKGITNWVDEQLNAPSAYDWPYPDDQQMTYLERYIEYAQDIDPDNSLWNSATVAEYVDPEGTAVFFKGPDILPSVWFEHALHAPDQLRQRVAYALSQIVVNMGETQGSAAYYDVLAKNALGNYRELLLDASFSSSMCHDLTFCGSRGDRDDIFPDENYARELMQLFTIGLHRLHLDGTPILDNEGKLIPTYTSEDVQQVARVFTGWYESRADGGCGAYFGTSTDTTRPICQVKNGSRHDYGAKDITLNNSGYGQTIPADLTPHEDVAAVIDLLMGHPNIGPFISKHLILRLVKSNPTPAYVARVASVFNDNGQGVKGDLKAVVRAILLDTEARAVDTKYARKAKEPLLAYTQFLRAFDVGFAPNYNRYVFASDFQTNLGQGPLASPTVFNFYDNEFIPAHDGFRTDSQVSPELQIINESAVAYMAYKVHQALTEFEHSNHSGGTGSSRYSISYDAELTLVESAIDNDYANLGKVTYREKVADALIPGLDVKLTNGALTDAQKAIIKDYLINTAFSRNEHGVRDIVATVVRMIVATEAYTIHK